MKYFLLIIAITLSITAEIFSQAYFFPLTKGNRWQFREYNYWPTGTSYKLYSMSVDKDSIINGKKYYFVTGSRGYPYNSWLRYDRDSNKLYNLIENSDYTCLNYNTPNGSSFVSYASFSNSQSLYVSRDSITLSDGSKHKTFKISFSLYNRGVTYAENLGVISDNFSSSGPGFDYYSCYVLCSAIYDSLNVIKYIQPTSKSIINHIPNTTLTPPNITVNAIIRNGLDSWRSSWGTVTIVEYYTSKAICEYYFVKDSISSQVNSVQKTPSDTLIKFQIPLPAEYNSSGVILKYRFLAVDKKLRPDTASTDWYQYQIVTSVDERQKELNALYLSNYPNPANFSTQIAYYLPKQSNVALKLFDILGNEIAIFEKGVKPEGNYKLEINTNELSSGIYFLSLITETDRVVKKLVITK